MRAALIQGYTGGRRMNIPRATRDIMAARASMEDRIGTRAAEFKVHEAVSLLRKPAITSKVPIPKLKGGQYYYFDENDSSNKGTTIGLIGCNCYDNNVSVNVI